PTTEFTVYPSARDTVFKSTPGLQKKPCESLKKVDSYKVLPWPYSELNKQSTTERLQDPQCEDGLRPESKQLHFKNSSSKPVVSPGTPTDPSSEASNKSLPLSLITE
ncbi:hypothetical protein H1C71_038434, partial [Ictidomys tridecemlineatus]